MPIRIQRDEASATVKALTAEHGDDALGKAAAEVMAKLRSVLPRDLPQWQTPKCFNLLPLLIERLSHGDSYRCQ